MSKDAVKTETSAFHLHTSLPLPGNFEQIDALQVLRAIAVTLVAWVHVSMWFNRIGQGTPNFGIFGIDLFFVISGFIMSSIVLRMRSQAGAETSWKFFRRRVIRIYPVYWIYALLESARLLHNHTLFQRNYVPSLFLLPFPNYPRISDISWTLMFEMYFYAVIAVLLMVTVRRTVQSVIALFCAAVFAGTMAHAHNPTAIIVSNPMLLEFVFGAAIALASQRFTRRRSLGIALLAVGIAGASYLRAVPIPGAMSMQMILAGQAVLLRVATWGFAAALIVGGTILWSPSVTSSVGMAVVVIGNASYSAYLCSTRVAEFTFRVFLKTNPALPLSFRMTLAGQTLVLLAILGVGWLSYQFVEWPLVRKIQASFNSTP